MRLISFTWNGQSRYGAVVDDRVVDLTRRIGGTFPALRQLIAGGGLAQAEAAARGAEPDLQLADLVLESPIADPEKIWCIGVNYRDRNAEYKDESDLPKYPSLFVRAPLSLTGHGQPIVRPTVSEQLDYEGELVLVIGKPGRHIRREQAFDHVFGMTLCNEGTLRDWLRHGKFNVTQGKNFDRSGSIGPWIVTADELDPRGPHEIMTRVNGEVRQHDTTERMMFPFDYLIAYLSTFATLKPGDIIVTGTPTGAGARFNPPRWLKPGDVVEVSSPGIGVLSNRIVDEETPRA